MTDTNGNEIYGLDQLVWREPPERSPFRGKYEEHKAMLKTRPGASVIVSSHEVAKAANSAAGSFRKKDGFVATVRKENGQHNLYVKFQPELVEA